jgi:hypothetical protein
VLSQVAHEERRSVERKGGGGRNTILGRKTEVRGDAPVERGALVAKALLAGAESAEVLYVGWGERR